MEGEYLSLDTAKKIEAVKKVKAILPEGVEAVVISKDDYDRLSGELTKENIELKLEIERLNNIMTELEIELSTKYYEYRFSECEELYAKAQEDKEILDYIKELKEK